MKFKHPFASKLICSPLFMSQVDRLEALFSLMGMESMGLDEVPKYCDIASGYSERVSKSAQVNVTTDFHDNSIDANTIAFHFIEGPIFADYDPWGWYFSTKQFRDDIIAAEANDKIIGHFFYVNSGGGEAWFLDQANEAVKNAQKPIYAYIEKRAASAGYYLPVNADKIVAATPNETIGSIGTMVAFWDITPYFEALGLKWHEHYSTLSDLKNKKFNNLLDGKPEQYIKEELDPLAEQFRSAVRDARQQLAKLEEDDKALRGETFATQRAIEIGLIDAQMTLEATISELMQVALNSSDKINNTTNALKLIS